MNEEWDIAREFLTKKTSEWLIRQGMDPNSMPTYLEVDNKEVIGLMIARRLTDIWDTLDSIKSAYNLAQMGIHSTGHRP